MDRYFVAIFARDAAALRALQKHDLDVFAQTAKQASGAADRDFPFSIRGLLSMKEIEAVAREGYQVLIEEPAEKRARGAQNVGDFSQWLQEMQAAVTVERAAAAKTRGKSSGKK